MPSSSLHIHAYIHTLYILVSVCLLYVLRSNIDNRTQPILPPSAPFLTLHLLQWLHRRYLSKLTNAFQERDSSPPPSCLFSGCSSSSPFPCGWLSTCSSWRHCPICPSTFRHLNIIHHLGEKREFGDGFCRTRSFLILWWIWSQRFRIYIPFVTLHSLCKCWINILLW